MNPVNIHLQAIGGPVNGHLQASRVIPAEIPPVISRGLEVEIRVTETSKLLMRLGLSFPKKGVEALQILCVVATVFACWSVGKGARRGRVSILELCALLTLVCLGLGLHYSKTGLDLGLLLSGFVVLTVVLRVAQSRSRQLPKG